MKKQSLFKKIGAVLLLGSLFVVGGVKVEAAAPSSSDKYLTDYPDIRIVDQSTNETDDGSSISGAYSTTLRLTEDVYYSFKGTTDDAKNNVNYRQNSSGGTVKFDKKKMSTTPRESSSVHLTNIAIFNGEYVDLRISIGASNPSEGGYIYLDVPSYKSSAAKKKEFLFFENKGGGKKGSEFYYKYEFLKAGTEEPVEGYRGMWNFRRVNHYKSVSVDKSMSHQMYVYNNTELKYNDDLKEVTVYGTVGKEEDNVAFTNLFDLEDGVFYTNTVNLKDYHNRLKYDLEPITKMELGYPQIMGNYTEDSNSRDISYRIIQDMPLQSRPDFYPKTYTMTVQMDPEFDVTTAQYKVKNVDGEDATQHFTLLNRDEKNNTLMFFVNGRDLASESFVDNSYTIDVKGSLKPSFEKNKGKYYDKDTGYYKIPASVYYQTNDNKSETNSGTAKLKAGISAEPIRQNVVKGTDTSKWKDKPVSDLFKNTYGAYDGDDLVIDSVQNRTFDSVSNNEEVSVTLKGSKSGITRTFIVPVTVTEVKSAFIHFTDENGKEISKTIEKNGAEGEEYDFTDSIKEIPNYTFSKVNETKGSPIKGVFPTPKEINIYVEYKMNDQLVTVNHVDEDGNPIAKATAEKYAPNSDHTFSSVVVPGYQVASVKVDGQGKTLSEDGKVNVPVKDKAVTVDFIYKAVQFSLSLDSDKKLVSANDTIDYTLDVKSGMKYPVGTESGTYKNVSITIPVDSKIKSISDITVVDSENAVIGTGEYNDGKITVTLTETVKDTDSFKVNYTAAVKGDAPSGQIIETKATMKASYDVNGATREVVKNSNKVDVSIKDSAAKTVAIHYIDEKGEKIINPTEMPGLELQPYDFSNEIKTIPGYKFVKVDETKGLPIKGILPAGNAKENIYVVYELAELKVTTNHVDEKGKSIAKESTQELLSGSDYTIKSVSVPGYKVKSVQVDGKDVPLTSDGNVVISVKDKAVAVKFTYESIHFTMKLSSDKLGVSPRGTVNYTLEVKSGMTYPEGTEAANYEGLEIAIPIDNKIDEVSKIKVVNGKDEVIGEGTFSGGKLNVTLTKTVKSTETIKVTYTAKVKNDVQEGQSIETEATMKATYQVNGEDLVITNKSNKVNVGVTDAATKNVTIHYVDDKGKEINDPRLKTGAELQDYDYSDEIITIPGYKYVEVDEAKGLPIKGTFSAGNEAEDIFIVYEQDEFAVTTKFVDDKGQAIATETVKKYIAGKEYTIPSVSVPGYKIKSVKVDGVDKPLSEGSKVVVSIKDKPVAVTFAYESVQYSLKLSVDKATVSQKDKLTYTLDVKSGMVYPEGTTADNYTNVKIEVPIDSRLTNVSDIKILNSKGASVGIGQFDTDSGKLKVSLTESVKNTENLKLSYTAEVKEDAKTGEVIEATTSMTASFQVNGESREISRESNKVRTTIAGGLTLASAPSKIDFGSVTYEAKDMTIENPSIEERLVISDTRSDNTDGWTLSASLEIPLSTQAGEELPGEVIYKTGKKETKLTKASQQIVVNQGDGSAITDITDSWNPSKGNDGVKLKFKSTDALDLGTYTGTIRWTLMAGQP